MVSKVRYAKLTISYSNDDVRIVSAIAVSLAPEAIDGTRLTLEISSTNDGRTLLLSFTAGDLVSLRAGVNTILRLMLSALNSIQAASFAISSDQKTKSSSQKD